MNDDDDDSNKAKMPIQQTADSNGFPCVINLGLWLSFNLFSD